MMADEEGNIEETQIIKARLDQAEWRMHRLAFILKLATAALVSLVVAFIVVLIVASVRSGSNNPNLKETAVVISRAGSPNRGDLSSSSFQFNNNDAFGMTEISKSHLSRVQMLVDKALDDVKLTRQVVNQQCGSPQLPNLEASMIRLRCEMEKMHRLARNLEDFGMTNLTDLLSELRNTTDCVPLSSLTDDFHCQSCSSDDLIVIGSHAKSIYQTTVGRSSIFADDKGCKRIELSCNGEDPTTANLLQIITSDDASLIPCKIDTAVKQASWNYWRSGWKWINECKATLNCNAKGRWTYQNETIVKAACHQLPFGTTTTTTPSTRTVTMKN